MIKPIVTSLIMLRMPSEEATPEDAQVGQDLLDTLAAHAHECVGLAANMIGVHKRVIVVQDGSKARLMYNPDIIRGAGEYRTEEACLSLQGTRPTARWRRIKVSYLDEEFHQHVRTFTGEVAQAIQHEIDHCNGVVI
ncbi:peptide deformylase [Collinsella sp. An2]|uniref:peptide deformylase n=1 Tax=Collinsella sp. An2 TaxID=1965585 RepID=UPI000B385222|nr:peptide deformylase [Collinsella sp. An2]OUP06022.1 peptide deformylase [Collinsella sp. An2]